MLSQRHCDTVLGGQDGTRPSNNSNAHKHDDKSIKKKHLHCFNITIKCCTLNHLAQIVTLHGPNRNAASCLICSSCLPLDAWSRLRQHRQLHSSALCSQVSALVLRVEHQSIESIHSLVGIHQYPMILPQFNTDQSPS